VDGSTEGGAATATHPDTQRRAGLSALARGSLQTLVGSVGSSVLGFLLVVVIGRGLHAGRAGVMFEVIALFTILSNVAELGADTGIVRFLARYRVLGRTRDLRPLTTRVALAPVMVGGAVLAIVLLVVAGPLARVLFEPGHQQEGATLIRVFAVFLPFATGTAVAMAGTRGLGTMRPFVRVQNLGIPTLRLASLLLVVTFGSGMVAVGLAWGLPVALGFVAGLIALDVLLGRAERRTRGIADASPISELAREFWRFSGPRGAAALITVALGWFDILLVGALRSAPEAGVYAAVSRFIGVGTIALQATAFAIAPQISGLLARDRRPEASTLFRSATAWVVAASWPMYLSLAIFAPLLLRVFGPGFVAGQDALTILALSMLVYVGVGNNKTVLLMAGGSGLNLMITGSWLAISLALDFLLIPGHGMEGAAVAYAVAIVGENLTTTAVVARRSGIDPWGTGVLVAALAAVGCYGAVGLAMRSVLGPSLISFLLFAVVASAIYLAVLWRFRDLLDLSVLAVVLRHRSAKRAADAPSAGPGGTRRSG
jgi:O-antigen/teichoic acid export membrane protein